MSENNSEAFSPGCFKMLLHRCLFKSNKEIVNIYPLVEYLNLFKDDWKNMISTLVAVRFQCEGAQDKLPNLVVLGEVDFDEAVNIISLVSTFLLETEPVMIEHAKSLLDQREL